MSLKPHYGKPYLIITIWKVFLVTDMKSFQIKSPYGDKYHHMNAWSERWIFSFSDQDGDRFELFSYGDLIKWWQIWFEMKSWHTPTGFKLIQKSNCPIRLQSARRIIYTLGTARSCIWYRKCIWYTYLTVFVHYLECFMHGYITWSKGTSTWFSRGSRVIK